MTVPQLQTVPDTVVSYSHYPRPALLTSSTPHLVWCRPEVLLPGEIDFGSEYDEWTQTVNFTRKVVQSLLSGIVFF